ncbi:MAG: hypothetical protein ABI899_00665 [Actinomycetota bacterium]
MTILQETFTTIGAFTTRNVDYLDNSDLRLQLRNGKNMRSGTAEGAVLVKLNVDQCSYNAVEVDSDQDPADAIDAAIQSLVVIRNELRMRAAEA